MLKNKTPFLAIKDKLYEEDSDIRSITSPSSTSFTSTGLSSESTDNTPSTSPVVDVDHLDSKKIIDQIYLDGEKLTEQVTQLDLSPMNPFEKQFSMGDLLCKISDYWDKNSKLTCAEDLEEALGYICTIYSYCCDSYKRLLNHLLTIAHNNQDFRKFIELVDTIPNTNILSNCQDIIDSFEYGMQLPLLRVVRKIALLLPNTKPNATERIDFQNEIYEIYESNPTDINNACRLLIRSALLNDYLQKYKNFSGRCNNHLFKDFIFIAEAMQHIYLTTQNNPDFQNIIKLPEFWQEFANLTIKLLVAYEFKESDLFLITDLNSENIQSVATLLKMLDPRYFLEFKPKVKPETEPEFLKDQLGRIMHANYNKRPSKPRIILQYIGIETVAEMINGFESYLKYPKLPSEVPEKILLKAKLLQRRYIEESFGKSTDIDRLLEYYSVFALRVENITNGHRIDAAISEYYFHTADFLAARYYQITGKSIPPLDYLEDYRPGRTLTMA